MGSLHMRRCIEKMLYVGRDVHTFASSCDSVLQLFGIYCDSSKCGQQRL